MARRASGSGPEKKPARATRGAGGRLTGTKSVSSMHQRDNEIADSVRVLAGLGLRIEQIGLYHELTTDTIRDHYGEEFRIGEVQTNAQVGAALFQTAKDRTHKSHVQAAIWWTKARMGWTEAQPDAAPLTTPGNAAPPPKEDEVVKEDFSNLLAKLKG